MGWTFNIGGGERITKAEATILMRDGVILAGHGQAKRALIARGLAYFVGCILVRTPRGVAVTNKLRSLLLVLALVLFWPATARADDAGTAAGASLVALGGAGLIVGAILFAEVERGEDIGAGTMVASSAFASVGGVVLIVSLADNKRAAVGLSGDGLRLRVRF